MSAAAPLQTGTGGVGKVTRTGSGAKGLSFKQRKSSQNAAHEFFSLEAVDFGQLKDDVMRPPACAAGRAFVSLPY